MYFVVSSLLFCNIEPHQNSLKTCYNYLKGEININERVKRITP